MQDFIKICGDDNVCVALTDIRKGTVIACDGERIELSEDILRGHKIALTDITQNENVIKYGFPIGHAVSFIRKGSLVHTHNIKTNLGEDSEYSYDKLPVPDIPDDFEGETFMGYERPNGKVGVRNELWIIPTVGCVNSIAKEIERKSQKLVGGNIEAVVAFNHPYGCSQMGDDQENTREALAGLINHPNAGGVLVLGLGCENSNIGVLKEYLGDYDKESIRFLQCQDVEDEVSEGVGILEELSQRASLNERTPQSISKLVIGMKCGGSDGLSGITANPVVGRLSDLVTGAGATTILTEVPEMFGAETILMNRAENEEVFQKTVKLIKNFKDYFRKNNQTIYENPSPGNKAGGISTLEDKALGCTQKSGKNIVRDVLEYGQSIKINGLNLLSAPGNDLVASTALAVAGAQIILFTTGRGTPFASAVPTVKISTNTPLMQKKSNWIDFDCGVLLNDSISIEKLGEELLEYVLEVASGAKVKSEMEGLRDLAIFKQGVTL